jgi:hypothetical protein
VKCRKTIVPERVIAKAAHHPGMPRLLLFHGGVFYGRRGNFHVFILKRVKKALTQCE